MHLIDVRCLEGVVPEAPGRVPFDGRSR